MLEVADLPGSCEFSDCARASRAARKTTMKNGKALPALARGRTQHTTESHEVGANTGRAVNAVRRLQIAAGAFIPRGTAEHTDSAPGFIQVLAPLPHVAAQIVDAMDVRRKAPHG